jgi:hypothetical protein
MGEASILLKQDYCCGKPKRLRVDVKAEAY